MSCPGSTTSSIPGDEASQVIRKVIEEQGEFGEIKITDTGV